MFGGWLAPVLNLLGMGGGTARVLQTPAVRYTIIGADVQKHTVVGTQTERHTIVGP